LAANSIATSKQPTDMKYRSNGTCFPCPHALLPGQMPPQAFVPRDT
jgi:hypothetical protein